MKNLPAKPNQLITREFAKQLNVNYNSHRAKHLLKSTNKEDANAIWYSLEALESYIEYIKTHGADGGYEVDGIRFYFGVYPDDKEHGEKAGLTTLFLAPTGKKIKPKADINQIQGFAMTAQAVSEDIESLDPMNYGNIGRPPALTY